MRHEIRNEVMQILRNVQQKYLKLADSYEINDKDDMAAHARHVALIFRVLEQEVYHKTISQIESKSDVIT